MTVVGSAGSLEFDNDNRFVSTFTVERQRSIENNGDVRFAGTVAVGEKRCEGLVGLQIGIEG